ncbi:hypothetical protein V5O48_010091 [Marasmius crinis-equi]|uniref:Ribonuclease H1 N-terminal domain-containing protein n=1 Tax=Marasmius crinis-equi TaxID=585013 RepID=A0ABR3F9G4_9AGAR
MAASRPPTTPVKAKGNNGPYLPSSAGHQKDRTPPAKSSTSKRRSNSDDVVVSTTTTTTTTTKTVIRTPHRRYPEPIIISSDEEGDSDTSSSPSSPSSLAPTSLMSTQTDTTPVSPSSPSSIQPSSPDTTAPESLEDYYSKRYPLPIPTPRDLETSRFPSPQYFAVTAGKRVGIFADWLQVAPLTQGCRQNWQAKYLTYQEALLVYREAYNRRQVMIVDKGGDIARYGDDLAAVLADLDLE